MRKNGNNEFNRGAKKSFISVLPIIGAGLLSAGTLAGVGLSIWQVSRTYKESSEFSNSTTARIKIDPVAFEVEGSKGNKELAEKNAKFAAERLSDWLWQNGQDSYDVNYELEEPAESGAQYYAYLTAKFKLTKIASKHTDDKDKIDNDPYLSIFENSGFNTNNKTFVYRWYNQGEKWTEPRYSVLNFSDLFVLPDTVSDSSSTTKVTAKTAGSSTTTSNEYGIVYQVNSENVDFLNQVYNDLLLYKEDKEKSSLTNADIKVELQPRFYIVNNIEGMFNEANYHLINWGYSADQGARYVDYDRIYKDSDYSKFAKQYSTTTWRGTTRQEKVTHLEGATLIKDSKTSTTQTLVNGDLLNWMDTKTAGTLEHSSILSKYVEDAISFDNIGKYFVESIDDDKLKNTLPKKSGEECKINYFWHPYSNQTAANTYFSNMIEKSWSKRAENHGAKIVSISFDSSNWQTNYEKITSDYKTTIVAPKFTETIFGGSKLVASLSLGFLIYLIILGILLSALYRMTGLYSWICMMFMLSITGLIAQIGAASVVSLSLLFGLFIMSIVGFVTALGICGRMKRRLLSNEDSQVIVLKTFKQSLWPSADMSIIALIFGICFTYLAPLGLNALGLALIVGAFANFIITYLLNGLLNGLTFNNKITIGHYGLFGPKHSNIANEVLTQGRNDVPATLEANKLEFNYYSKFCTKKLNVTGKRGIIALAVAGGLLIACIVIFLILGFVNTNMFHASNCLVVTVTAENKDNVLTWISEFGQRYNSYTVSKDGLVYYFYCTGIVSGIQDGLISKGATSAWVQSIIGATNRDILTTALFSIIIAGIISTVYIGIRNNWTSFVPMLASAMGLPLIILGLASAFQIKFDETVVLAYALTTVVNSIVTVATVNSINSVWSRHEGYNKPELKFIVNEALKNNLVLYILTAVCYALFIVAFGLTAPAGCGQITALLIIGLVVTMFFAPYVTAALLYWFLVIRNKALKHRANRIAKKVVVNYDEIDEQSIEGLNKFSKKIATPKEEPLNEQK